VETTTLEDKLNLVRRMNPQMILSSHLPPARGDMTGRLLGALADARSASPFIPPGQAALEQMLAAAARADKA